MGRVVLLQITTDSYYKSRQLCLLEITTDSHYKSRQLGLLQIKTKILQITTNLLQITTIITNYDITKLEWNRFSNQPLRTFDWWKHCISSKAKHSQLLSCLRKACRLKSTETDLSAILAPVLQKYKRSLACIYHLFNLFNSRRVQVGWLYVQFDCTNNCSGSGILQDPLDSLELCSSANEIFNYNQSINLSLLPFSVIQLVFW